MNETILIIDIDSKIPNLALAKINHYHKERGDKVIWNMPLFIRSVDKTYVSCVFTKNRDQCLQYEGLAEIGGSGYDLSVKLPPEIDATKPRINLGFTSRGCIRNCDFCIVREKEGKFHVTGDLLDLWDGESKLMTLMDNNILVDKDHAAMICQQAKDNGIKIDFNQGLDYRLLDEASIKILKSVVYGEMRFSFDYPKYKDSVEKAIKLLKKSGVNQAFWFVLIGFSTTFQEDYDRVMFLRDYGQTVFIQRFVMNRGNLLFSRWVNQHHIFKATTFDEWVNIPKNQKYIERYRQEIEEYIPRLRLPFAKGGGK